MEEQGQQTDKHYEESRQTTGRHFNLNKNDIYHFWYEGRNGLEGYDMKLNLNIGNYLYDKHVLDGNSLKNCQNSNVLCPLSHPGQGEKRLGCFSNKCQCSSNWSNNLGKPRVLQDTKRINTVKTSVIT